MTDCHAVRTDVTLARYAQAVVDAYDDPAGEGFGVAIDNLRAHLRRMPVFVHPRLGVSALRERWDTPEWHDASEPVPSGVTVRMEWGPEDEHGSRDALRWHLVLPVPSNKPLEGDPVEVCRSCAARPASVDGGLCLSCGGVIPGPWAQIGPLRRFRRYVRRGLVRR